ncbi:hypothetical protein V7654_00225 [Bacillus sp. JJ1609]|uniref:hypothetical protein n=1 Tax=Bacillus sp. JJ1609 TaxID=3122977 RepID=UPI002FFDA8BE
MRGQIRGSFSKSCRIIGPSETQVERGRQKDHFTSQEQSDEEVHWMPRGKRVPGAKSTV